MVALQTILLHNALIKRETKACVPYFSSFKQNILKIIMKNAFYFILKALFVFETFKFLYIPLLLFFPVNHWLRGWSNINLKVYDVSNYLNKNTLITHFVLYIEKEKRYDIEPLSIDRVLSKKHFDGKSMQKMCTKS